jgi:hypothetical protein
VVGGLLSHAHKRCLSHDGFATSSEPICPARGQLGAVFVIELADGLVSVLVSVVTVRRDTGCREWVVWLRSHNP